MRHLVHQRPGETEVTTAPRRRVPPGQRHLRGDTPAPPGSRQAGRGFGRTSSGVQCDGQPGLPGSRSGLELLEGGDALARQTGIVDTSGRPVRGLPPAVVSGGVCDCESAWRGAFLAHGSLTEPGRSSSLENTCPGPEAALALVGAARRLGIPAKSREVRGVDRVVIRDGDAIGAMLPFDRNNPCANKITSSSVAGGVVVSMTRFISASIACRPPQALRIPFGSINLQ
jgi:hypothetical protein